MTQGEGQEKVGGRGGQLVQCGGSSRCSQEGQCWVLSRASWRDRIEVEPEVA